MKLYLSYRYFNVDFCGTGEPLLTGHPDERPTPLGRTRVIVNLTINVLISTPDERPSLLKSHIYNAKSVASQEGFHCTVHE